MSEPLLIGGPAGAASLDGPLPPLARPLRIAAIVVAVFVGIFGLWAVLAPLSKAAVAPGILEVEGRRRVIQNLEGGIVAEIMVRENQRVRAGQPLIRLAAAQTGASANAAQSEYFAFLAERQRLQAELNGADSVTFDDELRTAEAPVAADAMNNQRALLASRRAALNGQTRVLRETASQARAEISGAQAQIASLSSQLSLLQVEAADVGQLVAEQLERRTRLLELQRNIAQIEGSIGTQRAAIARAQRMVAESEARIAALVSEQRDDTNAKLRDTSMRLADARERMKAATDIDQRRVITAPAAGQVVQLHFSTIGGVVRPGEPIVDLVPDSQQLIVSARVRPIDIENIHPGLITEVKLVPYSGRSVPTLDGHVIGVSEDVITPSNGGDPYYAAKIRIDDERLKGRRDIKLISGMPAEVFIVLGKRSLFQYLVQPLTDSFRRSFREE